MTSQLWAHSPIDRKRKSGIDRLKRRSHLSAWLAGGFCRSVKTMHTSELKAAYALLDGQVITCNYQAAKLLAVRRELSNRKMK